MIRRRSDTDVSAVGSLAAALFGAESALLEAERRLEDMLDSLYDEWQDWEADYVARSIDVYGITSAPSAADALRRAGFDICYQHEHTSSEFKRCACRSRAVH